MMMHDYPVGHGLKVDFLVLSAVKIGIELDGRQHYEFNERFHRSRNDWKLQRKRDLEKEDLCKQQGILLVRVDCSAGFNKSLMIEKLDYAIANANSLLGARVLSKEEENTNKWKGIVRDIRKDRYQKKKEWLKNNQCNNPEERRS